MAKIVLKTKEELDQMTQREIWSHKIDLVERDFKKYETYLEALSVYEKIRFKEEEFQMYERWSKGTERTEILLTEILDGMGREEFYRWSVVTDIQSHYPFEYDFFDITPFIIGKLSDWIEDDGCFILTLEGTDPENVANRVALIEKTPRIRTAPYTEVDDFTNWECGDKTSVSDEDKADAKIWCEEQLKFKGYLLHIKIE